MKCDGGDEGEGVTEEVGVSGEAGKGGGEGVRGEDVALEPGEGVDPEGPDARDSEQSPNQQFSSPPEQPNMQLFLRTHIQDDRSVSEQNNPPSNS